VGKKHYRLLTHHLKELIRFVEQGGRLETHDDILLPLQQQLYAEEQQKCDQKSGNVVGSPGSLSPITIKKTVWLLPSGYTAKRTVTVDWPTSTWDSPLANDLEMEGFRNVAVRKYSEWLQGQYHGPFTPRGSSKS